MKTNRTNSNASSLLRLDIMREEISELADQFGLHEQFSADVLDQAEQAAQQDAAFADAHREDLRDLPLATIDGSDAKDFDDAIFCRPDEGGYMLIVAIADVSSYIAAGSVLDQAAAARSTSVYFPGHVLPMLPPVLSEGVCSLKPNVDRLCLFSRMRFAASGKLLDYEFAPGIMRSQARLTYTQAVDILAKPPTDGVSESLHSARALTKQLTHNRHAKGALKLTVPTPALRVKKGRVVGVDEFVPLATHGLIEECMLAANVCASKFLDAHKRPLLYRVHAKPEDERTEQLRILLHEYGIKVGKLDDSRKMDEVIAAVMKLPKQQSRALILNVLRTLSRAVYTPHNAGHYGLGFSDYTHFTSPIRRYPDLLIHRQIHAALADAPAEETSAENLEMIGQNCSAAEQNAEKAERRVVQRAIVRLHADRIGESYKGVITGIAKFGIFVMFDGFAEGLLPLSLMRDDFYRLEDNDTVLVGRRSKRTFRVGMALTVEVESVDMQEGRCRLCLP